MCYELTFEESVFPRGCLDWVVISSDMKDFHIVKGC